MQIKDAISIEKLAELQKTGILTEIIRPIQAVLADIPAVVVMPDQEEKLRNGQAVVVVVGSDTDGIDCKYRLCINEDDRAVAMTEVIGDKLQPKRVFNY